MKLRREQAETLKRDLEAGLEKWRQQVLEVQENNIRRAELQAEGTKTVRRQRSREERSSRERRVRERRRQSKEREEQQLKLKQEAIQEKQKRVRFCLTPDNTSHFSQGGLSAEGEGGVRGEAETAGC